jgi:hypothetical protein
MKVIELSQNLNSLISGGPHLSEAFWGSAAFATLVTRKTFQVWTTFKLGVGC